MPVPPAAQRWHLFYFAASLQYRLSRHSWSHAIQEGKKDNQVVYVHAGAGAAGAAAGVGGRPSACFASSTRSGLRLVALALMLFLASQSFRVAMDTESHPLLAATLAMSTDSSGAGFLRFGASGLSSLSLSLSFSAGRLTPAAAGMALDAIAGTDCAADACGFGAADTAGTLGTVDDKFAADATEGAGLAAAAAAGLEPVETGATVVFGAATEVFGGAAATDAVVFALGVAAVAALLRAAAFGCAFFSAGARARRANTGTIGLGRACRALLGAGGGSFDGSCFGWQVRGRTDVSSGSPALAILLRNTAVAAKSATVIGRCLQMALTAVTNFVSRRSR
eukprot:m.100135 g.100135  ORF g.100135 m.100135 type:complete len:337 (-) comp8741_c0_seq2:1014-2024(-)